MPLRPPVVILADGVFPTHQRPLEALHLAGTLICCDGAADQLLRRGITPHLVVGDLDSLSSAARKAFHDRLAPMPSQDTGDLEKALRRAAEEGAEGVTVLGATGDRDDHSLGNLLMLWTDFGLDVTMLTDSGALYAVRGNRTFTAFEGQAVSLFPESAQVRITTSGLAFPLKNRPLTALHRGTSNHSLGPEFSVAVTGGTVLVFQGFDAQS